MSAPTSDSNAPSAALPAREERVLLTTLAAVQFTHILDFMIMMPLGSQLMRAFGVSPTQFSWLVAAYGLSAAVTGFAAGFVLDRFDRKTALLALYAGFVVATLSCALAPTFWALLVARLAAGACGGVAGSVVTAMVGDVIPPERRGRAMGTVMAAFPLASVVGVPLGISLATWFEWHAPFFMLAGVSVITWFVASRALPAVRIARSTNSPWRQMREIVTHPVHRRAFAVAGVLVFAGGLIIPFMAPTMVANVGLTEKQLPLIYFFGGVCTFFTMPYMGRLADRHDKLHVLASISVLSVIGVLALTNLPALPLPIVLVVTTLFFVAMSGRFAPTMAMVTNAVDARYRGGFMSVASSMQQAAAGLANLTVGALVTADAATGRIEGYPRAGLLAVGAFGTTVWLAYRLKQIAPYAARNPAPPSAEPSGDALPAPPAGR